MARNPFLLAVLLVHLALLGWAALARAEGPNTGGTAWRPIHVPDFGADPPRRGCAAGAVAVAAVVFDVQRGAPTPPEPPGRTPAAEATRDYHDLVILGVLLAFGALVMWMLARARRARGSALLVLLLSAPAWAQLIEDNGGTVHRIGPRAEPRAHKKAQPPPPVEGDPLQRGIMALFDRRPAEAARLCEQVSAAERPGPRRDVAYLCQGQAALAQGNAPQAELFARLVRMVGADARLLLGDALRAQGRCPAALPEYRRVREVLPAPDLRAQQAAAGLRACGVRLPDDGAGVAGVAVPHA